MQLQELVVPLKLDNSNFQSGIEGSISKASAFGSFMGNIAATAVTGAFNLIGNAVEKVKGVINSSVQSASNLSESINAVNVVFEEGAGIIEKYGQTSATAVGLSTSKFNQLASVTGAFLTNLGFNSEQAAHKTIELTERAADMASVFNTDVSDALESIQSGLKGEFNPLEKFGVKINAATISAKAMEMGLEDVNGELSESAKAQAALALIMEQTDKVAGDFTNTSEGLANQQRILAATFDNIKAKIGTALLPMLSALGGKLLDLVNTPEFQEGLNRFISKLEDIGKWVMDVGIPGFTEFAKKLGEAFKKDGLSGVAKLLDEELAKVFENIDWEGAGDKFGEFLGTALGKAIDGVANEDLPKSVTTLSEGIKKFLIAAVGGEENVVIWRRYFAEKFLEDVRKWNQDVQNQIAIALNNMIATIKQKLSEAGESFRNWATRDVPNSLNQWEATTLEKARTTLNTLEQNISQKLRDIAKEFFNRALGWTQQMKKGFEDGKGDLLGTLRDFVGEINNILKKIITSFTIKINLPAFLGGSGGGGTTNSVPMNKPGRASGGAVIGGQAYQVAEFYKPEVFTPRVSGRIDKLSANSLQMVQITNWSEFDYDRLATQIVKATNNA